MGIHYMAQVSLPYFTGIPEDVAINTFHFDGGTEDPRDDPSLITTPLERFYTVAAAPSSSAPGAWISPIVSRGTNACRIKLYDMSDPKPRKPFHIGSFTLPTVIGATEGMPNEVCVVASFHADPVSGEPQARRRGRVYLGPLTKSVFVMGTASVMPSVGEVFRTSVINAAERMCSECHVSGVRWMVYSRTDNNTVPVRSGWVDSDPDIQRRRENGVRTRSSWTINV